MLHAGLDLSRNRIDVCLLSEHGELVAEFATPSDADGVCALARRVLERGEPVRGVIESMTGARFVHDTLEQFGWDVLIADAQKVKGLAPLACKTDKIDACVLAVLSERELVPEIWLPDPRVRRKREQARFRMHLVHHKSSLKNRIHSTMITFGHLGLAGRLELVRLIEQGASMRGRSVCAGSRASDSASVVDRWQAASERERALAQSASGSVSAAPAWRVAPRCSAYAYEQLARGGKLQAAREDYDRLQSG